MSVVKEGLCTPRLGLLILPEIEPLSLHGGLKRDMLGFLIEGSLEDFVLPHSPHPAACVN